MKNTTKLVYIALLTQFAFYFFVGCGGPRFSIITTTNLGLHANSGDGTTRPPQVSLAYKRAELALVPTDRELAVKADNEKRDCYSSLAAFHFDNRWFGEANLYQFIATGHASRDILTPTFITEAKQAASGVK